MNYNNRYNWLAKMPINPYHPTDRCSCRECYWKRWGKRWEEIKKDWPEPEWDWEDLEERDKKSRQNVPIG